MFFFQICPQENEVDNLKVANRKVACGLCQGVELFCKDCMFFLVFIVEAKEDNDKLVGLLEKSEKMKEASMLFQIYWKFMIIIDTCDSGLGSLAKWSQTCILASFDLVAIYQKSKYF